MAERGRERARRERVARGVGADVVPATFATAAELTILTITYANTARVVRNPGSARVPELTPSQPKSTDGLTLSAGTRESGIPPRCVFIPVTIISNAAGHASITGGVFIPVTI